MKRNILAVVIPALLVAGTANAAEIFNKDGNKLDLYGKVDVRHQFADKRSSEDGDDSYARIGIKGETQISDQLTGFGRWEYNVKAKGTEAAVAESSTRLAFAGLKFANYGSLDYGRNYGVNYDVNAWTDVLPIFGGDAMAQTDNFMTGRSTGLLTYRNTDFFGLVDGLNFALQYQGQNSDRTKNKGRDTERSNGDGYGLSSTYDVGYGITVGGSYASSARTAGQKNSDAYGKRAEAWNIGAKYDANNVYLAAMYGETRNMTRFDSGVLGKDCIANKTQNIELTAQYLFSDLGLKPSLAYVQSKGKDLTEGKGFNGDLVKYVSVGTYYYFNKNLSTYVDYKINLLKKDNELGVNARNVFGVGLTYQF
ncbi:outer membrane protein, OpnP [Xenorhabdus nematophila F1]|uniref:porin n=1 Tax=Xenorhabdus nematophila TaxID=628 RepID=UPI00032759E6|nr:porin [Xenorhabdus nematophila]CCW29560.1 outer membrane protein, OpnP [Xenorhabdus nematophila F1]